MAAAQDKQAGDICVMDLKGISDVTDFFMICHGTSYRQVAAIADSIEKQLAEVHRRKPKHVEGRAAAEWILMDYIDFVIHIFLEEKREFYRLERLWDDAPRLSIATP